MIEFLLSAPFILGFAIFAIVSIAILLEFEKEGWATTIFSLGIALTMWAYKSDIWSFVSSNPMSTVYFALAYVVSGLVWSLLKWKSYIGNKVEKFQALKESFTTTTGEIKNHWNEWIKCVNTYFERSYCYNEDSPEKVVTKIIPKANDKKSLIVSWISYWPMSLMATLLNNPFRKFFEWIYGMVSGIYDKMGRSAAKNMLIGLEKGEDSQLLTGNKKR